MISSLYEKYGFEWFIHDIGNNFKKQQLLNVVQELKSHNDLEKAKKIIEYMRKIINLISPNTIFISIDGVAPFSKMAQQRERRYKSRLDKTIDDHVRTEMGIDIPNFWDKNAQLSKRLPSPTKLTLIPP